MKQIPPEPPLKDYAFFIYALYFLLFVFILCPSLGAISSSLRSNELAQLGPKIGAS